MSIPLFDISGSQQVKAAFDISRTYLRKWLIRYLWEFIVFDISRNYEMFDISRIPRAKAAFDISRATVQNEPFEK